MTGAAVPTGDGKGAARLDRRQTAMLVLLSMSSFVVVLDFASAFIPLPSMLQDLGGSLDEVTWVLVAFVLAFAVVLPPCVAYADAYGRRRLFLTGLGVFAAASLGCALAPSLEFLIGARVVLGIGAAMVEAAVFTLIEVTFQGAPRALAYRVQGAAFVTAALIAPVLSGLITTALSWEYIFWLNVVVGAVVLAGALRVVPEPRTEAVTGRPDLPGLALGGAGLFLLFFALIEGARFGWASPLILGSFGAAIVCSVLFLVAESRAPDPLIDPELFRDRRFAVGNLLRAASEFSSMGVYFALSHVLQVQLGYSALVVGLLLMSVIAGGLLVAPITENLPDRVDVRWPVILGFLLVGAGTFWVAHVSPDTGWAFFVAPLAVAGAGFVAQEGPTVSVRDSGITPAASGAAWRASYSIFLVGVGLGVAVVAAVWQSRSAVGVTLSRAASADAVNTALLSCVAMALLAAVAALFLSPGHGEAPAAAEAGR